MNYGNEAVHTLMSTNPLYVNSDQNLKEAIDIMNANNVRHIPVLSTQGNLDGIVSRNDIERFVYSHEQSESDHPMHIQAENIKVDALMTKNVRTIESEDPIKVAVEILSLCSYNALPVVDNGKLVGILTTTDILHYLLRIFNK